MCVSEHACTECVCVCLCDYLCMGLRVNLRMWPLGLLYGLSLPSWTGHLAGLHLGGVPLLLASLWVVHLLSLSPLLSSLLLPGLYLYRRGIVPAPKYSHNALQDSGEGALGVLGGAGQSLVGLFLLIGL